MISRESTCAMCMKIQKNVPGEIEYRCTITFTWHA